jgi:hypothetical protein
MGDALAGRLGKARNPRQFGWPMVALAAVATSTASQRHRTAALDFARAGMARFPPESDGTDWKIGVLAGKALFRWVKEKKRFLLESVHPGSSLEEVRASTAFEYDAPAQVPATSGPTEDEMAPMRGPVAKVIAENYPDFARRVWGRDAALDS